MLKPEFFKGEAEEVGSKILNATRPSVIYRINIDLYSQDKMKACRECGLFAENHCVLNVGGTDSYHHRIKCLKSTF